MIIVAFSLWALMLTDCGGNDTTANWQSLGHLSMSGEEYHVGSIAIDQSDNKPVVTTHATNKLRVYKWSSGTSWTDLGFPGTGMGPVVAMAIGPGDNKPVVVFSDSDNGYNPHVMKWSSGTSWTDLGYPSTQPCDRLSIVIDPWDNKPIVAIWSGNTLQVLKWEDGTSWTDLGFPDPAGGGLMAIVPTANPSYNKPIVVFADYWDRTTHVLEWSSGTSWTDLGNPSGSGAYNVESIVVAPLDNKPVVLLDYGMSIILRKWEDGTSWIDLGFRKIGNGTYPMAMAIGPGDNKPVVTFLEYSEIPTYNLRVLKWEDGNSWSDLGYPDSGVGCKIAIDPSDNNPVIAFQKFFDTIHVMKYNP